MSRKKIKINIKSNEEKKTPPPKENKEVKPESTPKPNRNTSKKKEEPPKKKLSASEKMRRAREARRAKNREASGKNKRPKKKQETTSNQPVEVQKKKPSKKRRKSGLLSNLIPLLFVFVLGYLAYYLIFGDFSDYEQPAEEKEEIVENPKEEAPPIEAIATNPNLKYGIDRTKYRYEENVVQEEKTLTEFFSTWRLPRSETQALVSEAISVIRPAVVKEGNLYACFYDEGSARVPRYVVLEPDNYHYLVFTLKDEVETKIVKRTITKKRKQFAGIVRTNLLDLHAQKKLNYQLLPQMEDALAWTIDFFHLKPGCRYKLYYDEIYADGEPSGAQIQALEFDNQKKTIRAYYYENGFFDDQARPMKRAFLKSPVKYARISSKFNLTRKHPVLKKVKPHLGTDYAAPKGTPIRAIADGTVTIATFKKNNGNYVKIKHDATYQSQYLHMDGFAAGIKPGVQVRQGQTIGFVGTTGLSTGPHVCFRFWKNNKQVDFLAQDLPDSRPLRRSETGEFNIHRDSLFAKLEAIN